MNMSNTLSFARLLDWIEGRLPDDEAQVVQVQVEQADQATRADIAWLRAFKHLHAKAVLANVPAALHERLVRRFDDYANEHRQPGFLDRLIGTLSSDSRLQTATAGVREVRMLGSERQLVYSTDAADVVLNIHPHSRDQHFDIHGQVFPSRELGVGDLSVQILRDESEYGITITDGLGQFTFDAMPPGIYEIILSANQFEIQIAPVELRP